MSNHDALRRPHQGSTRHQKKSTADSGRADKQAGPDNWLTMASVPEPQRRGRRIAMTPAERDAFLAEQRVCRVGTVGPGLVPHITPLWYVWDGRVLWLYSILRSRRWANLRRNPTVSV